MRAKTLDDAIALGNANGADCVSSEYIGSGEPLDWVCQNCAYRWPQSYTDFRNYVKERKACAKCGDRLKRTKKDMETIAESRGGRFLSTSFSTLRTEYLWENVVSSLTRVTFINQPEVHLRYSKRGI